MLTGQSELARLAAIPGTPVFGKVVQHHPCIIPHNNYLRISKIATCGYKLSLHRHNERLSQQ